MIIPLERNVFRVDQCRRRPADGWPLNLLEFTTSTVLWYRGRRSRASPLGCGRSSPPGAAPAARAAASGFAGVAGVTQAGTPASQKRPRATGVRPGPEPCPGVGPAGAAAVAGPV
jgi:hypothetical protein